MACWGWGDDVATIVSNERHIDLDADGGTTCAVTEAGEVACWGVDESAADAPPGPYTMVSTTDGYTCGVTEAGEVLCWGSHSERGSGASDEDRDYSSGYVGRMPDLPPDSYVAVTVGYSDYLDGTLLWACAARAGGGFTCQRSSGKYLHGEASVRREDGGPGEGLARGDFCSVNGWGDPSCSNSASYLAVSQAGDYACAITREGTAECWLFGDVVVSYGQLKVMTPPDPSPGRYLAISNAGDYACALTEAGEPVCWEAAWNRNVEPSPNLPPGGYVAVSDGRNHTCALTEAGAAVCWGWNNWGQTDLPPGRYVAISAGAYQTCARTEAGDEVCRGAVSHRSFLEGYVNCALADIGQVVCTGTDAPAGRYKALAVGWQHACALTDAGEPVCWAWESRRYDGYKEDTPAESPYHDQLTQPPPGPFIAISASEFRTCALTPPGEVVCWGDVEYEQIPLWTTIY